MGENKSQLGFSFNFLSFHYHHLKKSKKWQNPYCKCFFQFILFKLWQFWNIEKHTDVVILCSQFMFPQVTIFLFLTKQTEPFYCWFSFSIMSHQLSFGHGECTSLPGSSWFPPESRSPGWQRWWGNGRTPTAFCSGIPAVKDKEAMSKSSKSRETVLSTMAYCMAVQSHKRTLTGKIQ